MRFLRWLFPAWFTGCRTCQLCSRILPKERMVYDRGWFCSGEEAEQYSLMLQW